MENNNTMKTLNKTVHIASEVSKMAIRFSQKKGKGKLVFINYKKGKLVFIDADRSDLTLHI